MTAMPGTSEYSSFTIFLRFFTIPQVALMSSSAGCLFFYPSPKVDSASIVLELREPPRSEDEAVLSSS